MVMMEDPGLEICHPIPNRGHRFTVSTKSVFLTMEYPQIGTTESEAIPKTAYTNTSATV